MATPIRIPITASVDASFDRVFGSIERSAKRARQTVAREMSEAGADLAKGVKSGADKAEAAFARLARDVGADGGKMMDPGTRSVLGFVDATRTGFAKSAANFRDLADDAEKAMSRIRKAQEGAARAPGRGQFGSSRNNASGSGFDVIGGIGGAGLTAARYGMSVATDIAQGAGLDTSLQSHVANGAHLQTAAVQLSNAGYMPGQSGANGTRVDPEQLMSEARNVGNATATSANDALEGLTKFVEKTGDLQAGRDMLLDLARLSKATGASLGDMASGAGDVYQALDGVPDRAQATADTMKMIAAQGKEGSIEIKDLASQMAKVTAAAGQFDTKGGKEAGIAEFGALAQFTRQHGGASSSTQAATSLTSFMGTFGKGARRDEFAARGIAIDGANGKTRDPIDIIMDSLKKTGGKSSEMSKLFASEGSQRVVRGFTERFNENLSNSTETDPTARLSDAADRTRAEFEKLQDATMTEVEIRKSLEAAMSTQESQMQLLNNQFDATAAQLSAAVIPAFVALGPVILSAADSLGAIIKLYTGKDPEEDARAKSVAGVEDDIRNVTAAREARAKRLNGAAPTGKDAVDEENDNKLLERDQKYLTEAEAKQHDKYASAAQNVHAVHDGKLAMFADVFGQGDVIRKGARDEAGVEQHKDERMLAALAQIHETLRGTLRIQTTQTGPTVNPSGIVPPSLPTHK